MFSKHEKLLLAIVPKPYRILFVCAIILLILPGNTFYLGFLFFNYFCILIGFKIAILFHEIGHLLAAKKVGGIPRRLILGKGHEVFRKEIYEVKVIIKNEIQSGLASASFDGLEAKKSKLLLYHGGGILMNFGICFLLYVLFGFDINLYSGIYISDSFLISNLFLGLANLIPRTIDYMGMKLPSDGRSLLNVYNNPQPSFSSLNISNKLWEAFDLFETKQYKKAIELFIECQNEHPELKTINLNLSVAYLKTGEIEKAKTLLEELYEGLEKEHSFYALILNGLAWIHLLMGNIEKADEYSLEAINNSPNSNYIRGTRGSVLIEMGNLKKGIDLLQKDMDFDFPNGQTLCAAIYLMLAYHQKGDESKKKIFKTFIEQHFEELDYDEHLLFRIVNEKMKTD